MWGYRYQVLVRGETDIQVACRDGRGEERGIQTTISRKMYVEKFHR